MCSSDLRLLAPVAEAPGESLGEHRVEGARHEEGLDAHLEESHRGRGRVVRVQGREHEVSREGRLDRDDGGLAVADLTDQQDVGVGPEDRSQRRREERHRNRLERPPRRLLHRRRVSRGIGLGRGGVP